MLWSPLEAHLTFLQVSIFCCRTQSGAWRQNRHVKALKLASLRSRSLSELATLAEEDPHELHIEDGLPPAVIDTIDSAVASQGSAPLASHFPAALAKSSISEAIDIAGVGFKFQDLKAAASNSAPHLLGLQVFSYSITVSAEKEQHAPLSSPSFIRKGSIQNATSCNELKVQSAVHILC